MARAKLFTVNDSQAVSLEIEVAFPDNVTEVDIVKIGDARVMVPANKSWDDLLQMSWSDGFLDDREDRPAEERDVF